MSVGGAEKEGIRVSFGVAGIFGISGGVGGVGSSGTAENVGSVVRAGRSALWKRGSVSRRMAVSQPGPKDNNKQGPIDRYPKNKQETWKWKKMRTSMLFCVTW